MQLQWCVFHLGLMRNEEQCAETVVMKQKVTSGMERLNVTAPLL